MRTTWVMGMLLLAPAAVAEEAAHVIPHGTVRADAAPPPATGNGYQATPWGTTREQVHALFPGQAMANGAYLVDAHAAGLSGHAAYNFDDGLGLWEVTLIFLPMRDPNEVLGAFNTLEAGLREKYGPPDDCTEGWMFKPPKTPTDKLRVAAMKEQHLFIRCNWYGPETIVRLEIPMDKDNNPAPTYVRLNYGSRKYVEAKHKEQGKPNTKGL